MRMDCIAIDIVLQEGCVVGKLYCNTVYWVAVYCNTLHCIVAGKAVGKKNLYRNTVHCIVTEAGQCCIAIRPL